MYSTIALILAFILVIKYAFELIAAHLLLAAVDKAMKLPRLQSGEIRLKMLKNLLASGECTKENELRKAISLIKKCNYDIYLLAPLLGIALFSDHLPSLVQLIRDLSLFR